MKAPRKSSRRATPRRPAALPSTLAVPEYTTAPVKPTPEPAKETAQDEAIRKMLEAAYT